MKKVKQRVSNSQYGDCFPACLASLLELPIEVIPNDHSRNWLSIQRLYLSQFGLEITFHGYDSPIWSESPWIASVRSKNYEDETHAIIMKGSKVLFDPSPKSVYKNGTSLLGEKIVTGGYIIRVADFSLLPELEKYRNRLLSDRKVLEVTK